MLFRKRSRDCNTFCPGQYCKGHKHQSGSCNRNPCTTPFVTTQTTRPAVWTNWSRWTQCSKTCGKGVRTRDRKCTMGSAGTYDCFGQASQDWFRIFKLESLPASLNYSWLIWPFVSQIKTNFFHLFEPRYSNRRVPGKLVQLWSRQQLRLSLSLLLSEG